jgi:hypothetical protein
MRAAIYARYSSHEQDGGESIDFQRRKCEEYIGCNGWSLSEENVFVDKGESASPQVELETMARKLVLPNQILSELAPNVFCPLHHRALIVAGLLKEDDLA